MDGPDGVAAGDGYEMPVRAYHFRLLVAGDAPMIAVGVTPNDPLSVVLVVASVVILAIALFVANHNLKDRF